MNFDQPDTNGTAAAFETAVPSDPAHSTESQLDPRILADLARSGLNSDDARNMHIRPATRNELAPLFGKKMAARAIEYGTVYCIPYFDLDTGEWGSYGRYKFLDDCGKEAGENWPKYMSKPGSERRLYFPVVPGVLSAQDWKVVFSHTKLALYNVESEKAAYRLAKAGVTVVAGGGCWSHVGKASGQRLLKDYDRLDFRHREVVELLDSDVTSNPSVLTAQWDFCYAASERGAIPLYVTLPHAPDGEKQGPDDFIVNRSVEELLALPRQGFEAIKNFWELNKRYAVMTGKPAGRILDTQTGEYLKKTDFEIIANKKVAFVPKLASGKDSKPKVKHQEVKAGTGWITSGFRREYTQECFSPGQPRDLADGAYNAWQGFGCESEPAPDWEVVPESPSREPLIWKWHLDHLCQDEAPEMRRYLENNIAYPIKHPGGKNFNAPVLRSKKHGVGKSLFMENVRLLHGERHSAKVNHEQLFGRFNKWQKNVTLATCEEASSGADSRANGRAIKEKITQPTVSIELKGIDTFELPDRCNYIFASNEERPVQIDFDDRRFGVIEVKNVLNHEIGNHISKWARESGGLKYVCYHLKHMELKNLDGSDYDPHAPAPDSRSKQTVIDNGLGDYETWAKDFLSDEPPEVFLYCEAAWAAKDHMPRDLSPRLISSSLTGTGKIHLLGRVRLDPEMRNQREPVYGVGAAWGRRIVETKARDGRDAWVGQDELRKALSANSKERAVFFGYAEGAMLRKKDKF